MRLSITFMMAWESPSEGRFGAAAAAMISCLPSSTRDGSQRSITGMKM